MALITLKEYATRVGIDPATARQRAARGAYKTAVKLGRDWFIEENEPHIDNRFKKEKITENGEE